MGDKKTAVEWFADELLKNESIESVILADFSKLSDVYSKAKEMEKEQIMQGYMEGLYYDKNSLYTPSKEQYYNETYKTEKE